MDEWKSDDWKSSVLPPDLFAETSFGVERPLLPARMPLTSPCHSPCPTEAPLDESSVNSATVVYFGDQVGVGFRLALQMMFDEQDLPDGVAFQTINPPEKDN
jgi:hypothetical protein